jgi:phytoene desaturase (3,4-didehydrolycopene-forming)
MIRRDPSAAPEGKDALVVLVPVGHLLPGPDDMIHTGKGNTASQDWPLMVEKARAQILEILEQRLGVQNLKSMITWEYVNTPLTCTW